MRLIALALAALLIMVQFPLWIGKGGWLRAWELEKQVLVAQKKNEDAKARNAKLESEVSDLKQGTGAVEERARYELGMIKDDEVFVQVVDANHMPGTSASAASAASKVGNTPVRIPRSPPKTN